MSNEVLGIDAIQVLLERYIDRDIHKLFEEATPFWKRLKAGETLEVNSRGASIVNYILPNPQMKWMDYNGGIYPSAGSSEYLDMRVYWAAIAIATGFTKATLIQRNAKAIVDYVARQMKQDAETLMKEIEQSCWSDGSGIKGVVSSFNATTNTVTFAAPFGSTKLIKHGLYNFYSPGGTKRTMTITNCKLLSKGSSTTATFDDIPGDIANGDVICWVDSFQREVHGVQYHVSSGSGMYQGQSRGTYRTELTATEYDLQSAQLTVADIDYACTLNEYKLGSDERRMNFEIWSAPVQRYRYNSLGYSTLRAQVGVTNQFNGTFSKEPKHGQMKWNTATDCPDDKVYGLSMDSLRIYMLEEPQILKDDSLTMRLIPAFDSSGNGAHKAAVVAYTGTAFDIGSPDPRPNWVISNIGTTNLPTRLAAL